MNQEPNKTEEQIMKEIMDRASKKEKADLFVSVLFLILVVTVSLSAGYFLACRGSRLKNST